MNTLRYGLLRYGKYIEHRHVLMNLEVVVSFNQNRG